ncbi:hypothetical protein WEI85_02615 [Actinomycetes bacterium KLBMP 9797]
MDAAQQPAGAGATRPASPRARKTRLVLLMVGGLVALLCLGGAGVAFVAYRDATEPDRSSPDVAVSNYLRAVFVDRDDTRANTLICRDDSGLASIRDLQREIEAREQQYSISIIVSWGELAVQESGRRATVTTEISRTIADGSESDHQDWRFDVVDEGGWRVCGAARS